MEGYSGSCNQERVRAESLYGGIGSPLAAKGLAPTAESSGSVNAAINSIEKLTVIIGEEVMRLAERLNLVMRPVPPDSVGSAAAVAAPAQQSRCHLGDRLDSHNGDLTNIYTALQALRNRVDV